jgi:hypothetical protein
MISVTDDVSPGANSYMQHTVGICPQIEFKLCKRHVNGVIMCLGMNEILGATRYLEIAGAFDYFSNPLLPFFHEATPLLSSPAFNIQRFFAG